MPHPDRSPPDRRRMDLAASKDRRPKSSRGLLCGFRLAIFAVALGEVEDPRGSSLSSSGRVVFLYLVEELGEQGNEQEIRRAGVKLQFRRAGSIQIFVELCDLRRSD